MVGRDPNDTDTRDLPVVPTTATLKVSVNVAANSVVGRVRENNEDHYLIGRVRRTQEILETNLDPASVPPLRDEIGHAIVVADGMGGMASGEEASRLAILTGLELVRDAAKWHLDFSDPGETESLLEAFRNYFRLVNRRIFELSNTDRKLEGMGTTLTVAYSVGLRLFVVHAGDSRVYLYHGGKLLQVTRDHTIAQELATVGQITPAEVRTHKLRNVLTNYIGSPGEGIDAEIHRLDLADGDRLLACTDGLTDLVDDRRIAELLGDGSPQEARDRLIQAALDAGGRDNITVAVADYHVEAP